MSGVPPGQGQPKPAPSQLQQQAPRQSQPVYYGGGQPQQQQPVVYATQPVYGAQPTATVVNVPVQRDRDSDRIMWIVVGVIAGVCIFLVLPPAIYFSVVCCCLTTSSARYG